MDPMMALVVGWTLVGAFVFTMIMTCLSLVGWIKFADPAQQKKLFGLLIVELVAGVGAKALGGATLDRDAVGAALENRGRNQAVVEAIGALDAGSATAPNDHQQLNALVGLLRPVNGETTADDIARVRAEVASLPASDNNMRAVERVRRAVPELRRRD